MAKNEKFYAMARPPQDALNTISFGKLKGKSDISPQWRIEALTEIYGLCGVGWYYEIMSVSYQDVEATGERMVYVTVGIHIKENSEWSAPVIGIGGDFTIIKDKNGIHGNDEALQMALTDALGKAAKNLGIANDIYRGKFDTKYNRWKDDMTQEKEQAIAENQKRLDEMENWRIISPDNIEVKAKDGNGGYKWMNLENVTLKGLEYLLTDGRFEGIKNYVEEKIKLIKESK